MLGWDSNNLLSKYLYLKASGSGQLIKYVGHFRSHCIMGILFPHFFRFLFNFHTHFLHQVRFIIFFVVTMHVSNELQCLSYKNVKFKTKKSLTLYYTGEWKVWNNACNFVVIILRREIFYESHWISKKECLEHIFRYYDFNL